MPDGYEWRMYHFDHLINSTTLNSFIENQIKETKVNGNSPKIKYMKNKFL